MQQDLTSSSSGPGLGDIPVRRREVPGEMALVGKPGCECDLGQRKLRLTKHSLDAFDPPVQNITVRRRPDGLVKGACEMMSGEGPAKAARFSRPYFLVQVRFNVLAHPLRNYRRQPSAAGFGQLGER